MTEERADALIPMSEAVKILYRESIDNILFLKRQQWTITNYALLTYAAVAAVSKGANTVETTLLTIISGMAWVYSTFCMAHTQMTMTKYRSRLTYVYKHYFNEAEKDAFELWPAPPTFNYTPAFFYGLFVANLIAVAAAVYLLWRTAPEGALV